MIITRRARADLVEIFDYVARKNPAAAARLVDNLLARMRWIADTGFSGSPRSELGKGLRSYVHRERCIFYVTDDACVTIVRVIHGRRDLDNQTFVEAES